MSILINKDTKIICQGITGSQATFHIERSLKYGTKIVGGVTPGKGGQLHLGVPVFDTVKEAVKETGATVSLIFVPAKFIVGAVTEAIDANLKTIICITQGIAIQDMIKIKSKLKGTGIHFIGPNCPGVITPKEATAGTYPVDIHREGRIGVVSRSSTLTYEAVYQIGAAGFGQSSVVAIGDDMIIGSDFVEIVKLFFYDDKTDAVVIVGQPGGLYEEDLANYYKDLPKEYQKPIISFVAGEAYNKKDKVGYASDIVLGGIRTVEDKKKSLSDAGIIVCDTVTEIGEELKKCFKD